MEQIKNYASQTFEVSLAWLTSPTAWGQATFIISTFLAAYFARKYLSKILEPLLSPDQDNRSLLATLRRFLHQFLPLLLPILAYVFLGLSEQVAKITFGAGEVLGFGKRIFMMLGTWIFVQKIIYSPFLKMLGKYALLPIVAVYTTGLLDPATAWLGANGISLGNISFTFLAIIRGLVFGGFLFWLGRWSNDQSANYIRSQGEMRAPSRELASKAIELSFFAGCFLLLMNIMGINNRKHS